MNDQRKVIYEQRSDIMDADTVDDVVTDMRWETVNAIVGEACPPETYPEQWDIEGLKTRLFDVLGLQPPIDDWLKEEAVEPELIEERVRAMADAEVTAKSAELDPDTWHSVEKSIMLQNLDHHWKEHLATLDALRAVVHLRAYAQKTPINEYKHEAFALFQRMLEAIREDVTRVVAHARFQAGPMLDQMQELPELPDFLTTHIDPFSGEDDSDDFEGGLISTRLPPMQAPRPDLPDDIAENPERFAGVSRNAPCPCGSGRKFKHCHGQLA